MGASATRVGRNRFDGLPGILNHAPVKRRRPDRGRSPVSLVVV